MRKDILLISIKQKIMYGFLLSIFLNTLSLFGLTNAQPLLIGKLPCHGSLVHIAAGPFINQDRWDVLAEVDTTTGFTHRRIITEIEKTCRLELYSFDGRNFSLVWQSSFFIPNYLNSPPFWYWCCGTFDSSNKLCKLITFDTNQVVAYSFHNGKETNTKLHIKPQLRIEQAIGCDLNGDGRDEIVTLECPAGCQSHDSCNNYHVGVYKIAGDSLRQIDSGFMNIGGDNGIIRAPQFISKCSMKGYAGEIPVILQPQSDVSVSSYSMIVETKNRDLDIINPFEGAPTGSNGPGPIDAEIISEDERIFSYGSFLHDSTPQQKQYHFAECRKDAWESVAKKDPGAMGLLCPFKISKAKTGWLFASSRNFRYYNKLPIDSLGDRVQK